eukprot:8242237-Pyramimonas_sp.AAC.1
MLKVDGDRSQFTEIYKLLMKFSKGQKEIGDGDTQGILLTYDDDDEDPEYSQVEYFTDHDGS